MSTLCTQQESTLDRTESPMAYDPVDDRGDQLVVTEHRARPVELPVRGDVFSAQKLPTIHTLDIEG